MTDTIKAESTDSAHESSMPALKGVPDGPLLQGEIDPLRHYLAGISRYTLLTREEEEALTKAYYETGDPELASRLITSNLRLVIKIALDFQKLWMQNFLDLIQEGNIGLMQAVRKFDPYRGVKFSYYASFWIKAYILKFIMDNWRLVKIGTTQAQRKLFYNLHKEKDRLYALGYDPVPKLISDRLNVSEKDVIDMEQRMGSWEVSLDAPVKEDSEDRNMDFVSSTEDLIEARVARREIRIHLRDHLAAFKDGLEGKERIIFEERMLTDEPRTLQDLGQVFGISRERVRQIESRLKKKLKRFLQDRIPDIQSYPEGIEEA
jgi:RNA polymerase sigma-32 factor